MGSKNLKAVTFRGTGRVTVARPREYIQAVFKAIESSYADFSAESSFLYGTSSSVAAINDMGILPSYNFKTGHIENAHKISGPYLVEKGYLKRRMGCNACIFSCHRYCEVSSGPFAGAYGGGPEYETMSALGSGCGTVDVELVIKGNELCNIYGMDTISAGGAVQWAMECFEKGVLTEEDTGGIRLDWGDPEAILHLLELMAFRRGLGDVLADGLKRASKKVGQDSYKWAIQANGLEQSRVETRGAFGYALAFAVNPRGPDHLHTEALAEFGNRPGGRAVVAKATGDEKYAFPRTLAKRAEIVRWHEDCYSATDALGVCAFATTSRYGVDPEMLAELLSAAVGKDFSEEELMKTGRKTMNLERAFNIREGADRSNDRLPYRLMHEALPRSEAIEAEDAERMKKDPKPVEVLINSPEILNQMLDRYYDLHGWDPVTGVPRRETLESLAWTTWPVSWIAWGNLNDRLGPDHPSGPGLRVQRPTFGGIFWNGDKDRNL